MKSPLLPDLEMVIHFSIVDHRVVPFFDPIFGTLQTVQWSTIEKWITIPKSGCKGLFTNQMLIESVTTRDTLLLATLGSRGQKMLFGHSQLEVTFTTWNWVLHGIYGSSLRFGEKTKVFITPPSCTSYNDKFTNCKTCQTTHKYPNLKPWKLRIDRLSMFSLVKMSE